MGLAAAAPAAATTVELTAVKGCYIVSPDGGTCWSTTPDSVLPTGAYSYSPYIEYRSLLRFDFSSIPSGATINSARLELTTQFNVSATLDGTEVRPLNDPWGDAAWDTPDGINEWYGGTPYGYLRADYYDDDGTTIEFDAQNVVDNWTSGALDNNGFLVSNSSGLFGFDGIDEANPPTLTIDYTP